MNEMVTHCECKSVIKCLRFRDFILDGLVKVHKQTKQKGEGGGQERGRTGVVIG